MELFIPLPVLWSKNFFNKNFLISTQEFKIDFQNRNRNYLNRKRNYLSHFRATDQKTSFTRCSHFSKGVWDWYSKREMELSKQEMEWFLSLSGWWSNNYFPPRWSKLIFRAGNGIIYPTSGPLKVGAVSPPQCSPLPLPHSSRSWILRKNIWTYFYVQCPPLM